jgi:hypothetical protein
MAAACCWCVSLVRLIVGMIGVLMVIYGISLPGQGSERCERAAARRSRHGDAEHTVTAGATLISGPGMPGQPNSRKSSCLAETPYDMQREWGWIHMSGRVLSLPCCVEKAFDASGQRRVPPLTSSRPYTEHSGLGQIDMWWSQCEEATCIDGRRLEDLLFRVYDATSRSQYQYPVGFTAEHDLSKTCLIALDYASSNPMSIPFIQARSRVISLDDGQVTGSARRWTLGTT